MNDNKSAELTNSEYYYTANTEDIKIGFAHLMEYNTQWATSDWGHRRTELEGSVMTGRRLGCVT